MQEIPDPPSTARIVPVMPEFAGLPWFARYAVRGAKPLPFTEVLEMGESVRRALMSLTQARSPVFSGRTEQGKRQDGNRHAYYLAEDEDGDDRIDHVTVFAREGFGAEAHQALRTLRSLSSSQWSPPLLLLLEDLAPHPSVVPPDSVVSPGGENEIPRAIGPCVRARTWISSTPFVLSRHPKRNGRDGPLSQLREELERGGFDSPEEIEILLAPARGPRARRWSDFRHRRSNGQGRVGLGSERSLWGFRITFPRPQWGPLVVGYGAHFGLGRFAPL